MYLQLKDESAVPVSAKIKIKISLINGTANTKMNPNLPILREHNQLADESDGAEKAPPLSSAAPDRNHEQDTVPRLRTQSFTTRVQSHVGDFASSSQLKQEVPATVSSSNDHCDSDTLPRSSVDPPPPQTSADSESQIVTGQILPLRTGIASSPKPIANTQHISLFQAAQNVHAPCASITVIGGDLIQNSVVAGMLFCYECKLRHQLF
jgi:hypothetical protein